MHALTGTLIFVLGIIIIIISLYYWLTAYDYRDTDYETYSNRKAMAMFGMAIGVLLFVMGLIGADYHGGCNPIRRLKTCICDSYHVFERTSIIGGAFGVLGVLIIGLSIYYYVVAGRSTNNQSTRNAFNHLATMFLISGLLMILIGGAIVLNSRDYLPWSDRNLLMVGHEYEIEYPVVSHTGLFVSTS